MTRSGLPAAPGEAATAKTPGRQRTGLVGVIVPLVDDPYFSAIVAGAAEGAHDERLRVVLLPTRHDHARELSLLDRLTRGDIDGAVIVLPEASGDELLLALTEGCPFVVVDPLQPLDTRVPCVQAAHRSGSDQAMRHLLELGHRRIAAITGPPGWWASDERRGGYRAALAAAGIPHDPTLEVAADFEVAPGAEATATLLDLPDPPTAIFAFNDNIAIGALQAARRRGLRVPEDLSVVGFDDVKSAWMVVPSLTTVRQPLAEMGRTAISLLLRLLRPDSLQTRHIELPTRLVVRESTAPPPN